jgi:hypothetical protein
MKEKSLKQFLSIESVFKYVRNKVKFKNERSNELFMRKTAKRLRNIDELLRFSGTKNGPV